MLTRPRQLKQYNTYKIYLLKIVVVHNNFQTASHNEYFVQNGIQDKHFQEVFEQLTIKIKRKRFNLN